jgi:hypothetical protein
VIDFESFSMLATPVHFLELNLRIMRHRSWRKVIWVIPRNS